jgi:hypothetical protein
MKRKIILNEDYIIKGNTFLLNDAPLNYLYGKEAFFTGGLSHSKYHLYGMVGLLGGHPNDYEFDNSINVFVMSDSLFDQMKNGVKGEILILLENRLNSKGYPSANLLIITESSLIDFVQKRISYYGGDAVVQNLINHL